MPSYHRARIGLLLILNIRIFSAWIETIRASNRHVGFSHLRPPDLSRSSILMAPVLRTCRPVQWTHNNSSHGVNPAVFRRETKCGWSKTFVSGERISVWMDL